jgi:hypothetical protein
MRITEIIVESQLDEGIGSALGRGLGHVRGAAGAAGRSMSTGWQDAKQGYKDAKGSWDPKNNTAAATPAAGKIDPTLGAGPSPAVWNNARNPGAPAATSPQGAAPVQGAVSASPAPASPGAGGSQGATDYAATVAMLKKLSLRNKKRLLAVINKDLAVAAASAAPVKPVTPPASPAAPVSPVTPPVTPPAARRSRKPAGTP